MNVALTDRDDVIALVHAMYGTHSPSRGIREVQSATSVGLQALHSPRMTSSTSRLVICLHLHGDQDVLEELDPSIEPVLSKAIIKQGNREVVKLGDKELDWSHDFRLYITTKLGNPHYTPEVRRLQSMYSMPWKVKVVGMRNISSEQ